MPYGMNRYLFSLTNVPFVSYNAFFLVGMIPNTSLNLLIGVALAQASDAENGVVKSSSKEEEYRVVVKMRA